MAIDARPCLELCDTSFPHRGFLGRLSDCIVELLTDAREPRSYLGQL